MDKISYGLLLFIFFLPLFSYLFRHRKKVMKYKGFIACMGIFGFVGYFVAIPLGAYWGCWGYFYNKTSNIRIGQDLVETLVWAVLGCIVLGAMIAISAEKEEKKKTFWPLF